MSANFSFIFVHRNENPEFMSEDMRRLHYRLISLTSVNFDHMEIGGLRFLVRQRLMVTVGTSRLRSLSAGKTPLGTEAFSTSSSPRRAGWPA